MFTLNSTWSRYWGDKKDHIENAKIATLMLLVTVIYDGLSLYFIPEFSFNAFEFIGTWAGLTTVWLARTQNVLCWPWGVVSALALGYFFATIGLPGQQWLNWGYFLIIQFWAWKHWVLGGKDETKLPVTTLGAVGRTASVLAIAAGAYVVYTLIDFLVPGSQNPILDAIVVSSSIVAQYLLGRKNVESWVLWLGPVNLLSIILFYQAEAFTVMALYVAFLIHAVFAIRSWYRSVGVIS